MIEIPRNGFKTSRSLSPVIMQSALPDKASSRYLLSFGSRQATILCVQHAVANSLKIQQDILSPDRRIAIHMGILMIMSMLNHIPMIMGTHITMTTVILIHTIIHTPK